jgi:hypothetical protein
MTSGKEAASGKPGIGYPSRSAQPPARGALTLARVP